MAKSVTLYPGPPVDLGWLDTMISVVSLWSHRWQSRIKLAELDEHLLADIGIDRYDAARERHKPFWRA